jgi:hypothetical protein
MTRLTGHSSPSGNVDTSIAGATLIGRGTTADHTFELNATSISQQPMRAIASGGWREGAWRGSLIAEPAGRSSWCAACRAPRRSGRCLWSGGLRNTTPLTAVELRRQDSLAVVALDGLQPQATA